MLHILLCSYFLVKDYVDRILQPVFTALSVFPTITQQTVEIYADHIIVIIAIITTRPKLAYGRQGLAGGIMGLGTVQAGTFWVF